jgi:hypothetical protein
MRRLFCVLGVALASLAIGVVGATGTHSSGTGPSQDLVAGTGKTALPAFAFETMVHVNAQRDPETGEARGHFVIREATAPAGRGFDFHGRVTCLTVVGNNAGLVGEIEQAKLPNPALGFVEGNFIQIRFTDMGEPGTLDGFNFSPGTPTAAELQSMFGVSCATVGGDIRILQGNYIVHQDPPIELFAILDTLLAEFELAAGPH